MDTNIALKEEQITANNSFPTDLMDAPVTAETEDFAASTVTSEASSFPTSSLAPADHDDFTDESIEEDNIPSTNAAQDNKLMVVAQALRTIQDSVARLVRLLEDEGFAVNAQPHAAGGTGGEVGYARRAPLMNHEVSGQVIEGVFDGQHMVGSDGKQYLVPPNYASKSKLVEGDMLKLTITPSGAFIYKQIAPVGRGRQMGELGYDETVGEYYVADGTTKWRVLKASVTYFHGEPGDQAVVLVPEGTPSKWAAVENIVKKGMVV